MGDIIAEARMREYLADKGLSDDFGQWSGAKDAALKEISSPAVYIEYTFGYRNRSHSDQVNLTPWLSTAPEEDVRRLLDIDYDDLVDEESEHHDFLEGVIYELLDEEQREWHTRARDTSMHLYGVRDEVVKRLPEIRPSDYDRLIGSVTVASDDQPSLI